MSRTRFDETLTGADAQRVAEFERDLARELAIDPSPEMLVRVRLRVAEHAASASRWHGRWVPVTVATGAIVLLVATFVSLRTGDDTPPTDPMAIASAPLVNALAVAPALPRPSSLAGAIPPAAPKRTTPVTRRDRDGALDVVVPPGQQGDPAADGRDPHRTVEHRFARHRRGRDGTLRDLDPR
jgi:hypothetical protein